jgi:hypothetical protein
MPDCVAMMGDTRNGDELDVPDWMTTSAVSAATVGLLMAWMRVW